MAFRLVNREKLLAPGICLLCERKPPARVVDTGYKNIRNTVTEPLRGRKYICDRCGELIAKALGHKTGAQYARIEEELAQRDQMLADTRALLDIQERIDALSNVLAN